MCIRDSLMVVQIDPTRYADPEIASEGERPRLEALAKRYAREDLMRAFDLLSRAEYDIKQSSQPRHTFEMTLVKWLHLRQLIPLGDLIARLEGGAPLAAQGGVATRPATPAPAMSRCPRHRRSALRAPRGSTAASRTLPVASRGSATA